MTSRGRIVALSAEVDKLVGERQSLRENGADALELERNRLRIIDTQWQLARAFIDAYSAAA